MKREAGSPDGHESGNTWRRSLSPGAAFPSEGIAVFCRSSGIFLCFSRYSLPVFALEEQCKDNRYYGGDNNRWEGTLGRGKKRTIKPLVSALIIIAVGVADT